MPPQIDFKTATAKKEPNLDVPKFHTRFFLLMKKNLRYAVNISNKQS
jgi:hypothetical protein